MNFYGILLMNSMELDDFDGLDRILWKSMKIDGILLNTMKFYETLWNSM